MSKYIDRIKELANEAIKKQNMKAPNVSKRNLIESIELTKKKLEIFVKCLESMLPSDRKALADRIFDLGSIKNVNTGCAEYLAMSKAVAGNDLRVYFSTFEICANGLLEIVNKVLINVDKIFDNKNIRIENITLGQFAVFGMLEQASIFSKFSSYLLDMISHDILSHNGERELHNIPQYKPVFIEKNKDLVYDLAVNLKTGYISYMRDINKVLKSNSNVKLVSNTGDTNIGLIDPDEHTNNLFLRRATFNPFFLIGETWVLIKHYFFQRNVKEREYLESHLALLKLELDGKDPDSPEYQHHVKVINAYNKLLTELDEKISRYENS